MGAGGADIVVVEVSPTSNDLPAHTLNDSVHKPITTSPFPSHSVLHVFILMFLSLFYHCIFMCALLFSLGLLATKFIINYYYY